MNLSGGQERAAAAKLTGFFGEHLTGNVKPRTRTVLARS